MSADAQGGQKKATDPKELELQELVSCQLWMLRTKLVFSVGDVQALNH